VLPKRRSGPCVKRVSSSAELLGLNLDDPPPRGGTPAPAQARSESHRAFRVRRKIALDETAPAGDRLRAIEQIESRALGKPKETVEHQTEEPEAVRALRALTPKQRLELWRRRGVHVADEEPKTETG
jgi:hypothetical protein